jgi:hypothetical protein
MDMSSGKNTARLMGGKIATHEAAIAAAAGAASTFTRTGGVEKDKQKAQQKKARKAQKKADEAAGKAKQATYAQQQWTNHFAGAGNDGDDSPLALEPEPSTTPATANSGASSESTTATGSGNGGRQCAHCNNEHGGPDTKLVQCAACKQVCYCNMVCQKAHWIAAHRAQCPQFCKLSAAMPKKKLDGKKQRIQPQQQPRAKGVDAAAAALAESVGLTSTPGYFGVDAAIMQEQAEKQKRAQQKADGAKLPECSECAICMDCMLPADKLVLGCGHAYHRSCVAALRKYGIGIHNEALCPQCRVPLLPGPDKFIDEAARMMVRVERLQEDGANHDGSITITGPWFKQAEALLQQALTEKPGNARAQFLLGFCYLGISESSKVIDSWCAEAEGYPKDERAQFSIGACYSFGDDAGKDAVKAAGWFRKAAEQGHADAQFNLGLCYCYGNGASKDSVKAAGWYRKAAEQGHAGAQHNLDAADAEALLRERAAADAATRRELERAQVDLAEKAMAELLLDEEEGARAGSGVSGGDGEQQHNAKKGKTKNKEKKKKKREREHAELQRIAMEAEQQAAREAEQALVLQRARAHQADAAARERGSPTGAVAASPRTLPPRIAALEELWGVEAAVAAGGGGRYLARVEALEVMAGKRSEGTLPARVAALERPSGLHSNVTPPKVASYI